MEKAILAAVMTVLVGGAFALWLHQLPEIGSIIAIAVMGGFIIYFNEKKR